MEDIFLFLKSDLSVMRDSETATSYSVKLGGYSGSGDLVVEKRRKSGMEAVTGLALKRNRRMA